MKAILNGNELVLGTCYYPEHWEEKLWEEDLKRMLESGIRVIRIAEFAWNKIEPTEGNFTYEFYDRFLDLAEKTGMKVIFCTPTATPPAWLTNKYPEVLNADINGVLYRHGARRHYNYNSPKYLKLSERIVEKSASHYAKHPAIIGWQIDNELNCELDMFYSESDSLAFREFLKNKYQTLDALNKAWGTEFWNQTYTGWEEIYVPRHTNNNTNNPHQELDFRRFISDSVCRFAKIQSDIIRKYKKEDDFITTNGLFGHLDYQRFNRESMDFVMYDSYPNFAYMVNAYNPDDNDLRDRKWSRNLAETRAISEVFGIMEQQSGAGYWTTWEGAPTPRPGQIALWTMQSVAHGADYVSYFRWRTCTFGTEMYWHGILDYSGRDNERLAEIRQVNNIFAKTGEVSGGVYQADVAVLKDYDNIFDAEYDISHRSIERQSNAALFQAMQKTHTPFDFLYIDDETAIGKLKRYKVIFYPHPVIMSKKRADLLKQYVSEGGTLILGCRSAYKDMDGKCVMEKLPGLLAEVAGADVFEYTLIAPDEGNVEIEWKGRKFTAEIFVDRIASAGERANTVGAYSTGYFAGDGAVTENHFGEGKCYYYGTAFNEDSVEAFLEETGVKNPYGNVIDLPSECELAVRKNERGSFLFVLNYKKEPVTIKFKTKVYDMINGQGTTGAHKLEKYGFAVYKLEGC